MITEATDTVTIVDVYDGPGQFDLTVIRSAKGITIEARDADGMLRADVLVELQNNELRLIYIDEDDADDEDVVTDIVTLIERVDR